MKDKFIVGEFEKNTQEVVRAQLHTYKGHELFDLRVWAKKGSTPTKKGLTLDRKLYPELRDLMRKLGEALEGIE